MAKVHFQQEMQNNTTTKHTEVKMSNKQTAVQEMIDVVQMEMNNGVEISMRVFMGMLQKAKKMEKQQIMDAIKFGQNNHTVSIIDDKKTAEKYYNETFGGEEMTVTNNNNNPVTPKPNNTMHVSDEMNSRLAIEKKLWDSMVEWDKNNKR